LVMNKFSIEGPDSFLCPPLRTQIHLNKALGLSSAAGITLWFSAHWEQIFSVKATLWLLGLLGCSLALWLWFRTHRQPPRSKLNSVFFSIYALFWFLVGPVFFQSQNFETAILISAVALITSNSLLDLHFASTRFRQLFLFGVSTPLCISLLNTKVHIGISAGLLIIIYLVLQRTRAAAQPAKGLQLSTAAGQTVAQQCELPQAVASLPTGFIQWDIDRRVVYQNQAAMDIFGQGDKPSLGCCIDQLINDQQVMLMPPADFDQLLLGDRLCNAADNITKNSTKIICKWQETILFDSDGNVCGGNAYFEDVTAQIKMIVKIKQRAYFDLLTGLPNRYRLTEEISRALSSAQRTKHYCALLFIDLDHFKQINDRWGHSHGDSVLVLFAQRLRKVIRNQETVARLGGDEFVALLEGLGANEQQARFQITQVAKKIIDTACIQFTIDGKTSRIGCSIGITLFNDASLNGNDVLDQADQALYDIKRGGRSNYIFHGQKLLGNKQAQQGVSGKVA